MAVSKENVSTFYHAAQGISRARREVPDVPMHVDQEVFVDGVLIYSGPSMRDRQPDPKPRGWTAQSG